MNEKFPIKDPRMLRTEIEKLISFEEKDDLLRSQQKAGDENPDKIGLPSKYARVLSCSFVTQTEEIASTERAKAW
jgi:hypothetical protein